MVRCNYILMHKQIPVLELFLNQSGMISQTGKVFHSEHLPVGVSIRRGIVPKDALNIWWADRSIPASRDKLKESLSVLQVQQPAMLPEKCLGLSLSDHYWICPIDRQLHWSDLNFWTHEFCETVGNVLLGQLTSDTPFDFMCPDCTTDGWLRKKWTILHGTRYLIKGGSGLNKQEVYNEVAASHIMTLLHIPHVEYHLLTDHGQPYSICKNFLTANTELIPAWYIMQTKKKENHVSVFEHFLSCCADLHIPNVRQSIDKMIVLDYLIANEDRHQANFGAIRNADTLEYIGMAPIYDSGTALWMDHPVSQIGNMAKVVCKPFKSTHQTQLSLVSSFDWLDLQALEQVVPDAWMQATESAHFLEPNRRKAIFTALGERVKNLKAYINQYASKSPLSTQDDVLTNVRYAGISAEK